MTGPLPRYDVLAIGRSSIDLYAHEIGVPITEVTSFDAYVGGCPTNVSVGTRRLGLRSALLTAVGDDQVGDFVSAFLEREDIETRFIPRKPGHRTSAVILTIQPPDRFPLTFYRDNCADRELTIDDVRARRSRTARRVRHRHRPQPRAGARRDARRGATAARGRAPVVVDIDYRPDQWDSAASFAAADRSAAALGDARRRHRRRARRRGGATTIRATAPRCCSRSGIEALILKRGARGADHLPARCGAGRRPPFPIEVLNVLGAGDAFASGFIYGFRRAGRSSARLAWATRAARSSSRVTAAPTSCRRATKSGAFVAREGRLAI